MFQVLSGFQCVDEIIHRFVVDPNELFVVGRTYLDPVNQIEFFGTGSAWNDQDLAVKKCQAECVERWAIDLNLKKSSNSLQNQLKSNENVHQVLSISNGVAFSNSSTMAIESARNELIERHSLLFSWYFSQNSPVLYRSENFQFDRQDFQFDDYFIAETQDGLLVGVSCLFHRSSLLHFGFGTASCLDQLYLKSRSEALQRYLFLGDEYNPEVSFQANPSFHQEFYCQPWNKELFLKWFHRQPGILKLQIDRTKFQESLLWEHEDGRVIRSSHPDLIQLFFGKPDFPVDERVPSIFHPMA